MTQDITARIGKGMRISTLNTAELLQPMLIPPLAAERVSLLFEESDIFTVPEGVSDIRIFAVGAPGGSGNGFGVLLDNGGVGSTAVSNIKVYAGESLDIFVGMRGEDGGLPKGGAGGSSASGFGGGTAAPGNAGGGGGGGGASGVSRIVGGEIVVVAGGGAGGSGVGSGGRIGRGRTGSCFATNDSGLAANQIDFDRSDRCNTSAPGCGGNGGGLLIAEAVSSKNPAPQEACTDVLDDYQMEQHSASGKAQTGLVILSYCQEATNSK